MTEPFGYELTADREHAATILHDLADGVAAGAVRLGEGDDALSVDLPAEMGVELEFETDDDARELEVELTWPSDAAVGTNAEPADQAESQRADQPDDPDSRDDGDAGDSQAAASEAPDQPVVPAEGAAARTVSLGRFELFEDRGGEWRWRLRHRNGNVIATSGEGYSRKHNARKGLRSVMRNADGADVTERPG